MISLTYSVLFLGVLAYVAASIVALSSLKWGDQRALTVSQRLMIFGGLWLLLAMVLRGITWGRMPLSSAADALLLFSVVVSAVVFFLTRQERTRALLMFYLPPLALITIITAILAVSAFRHEPRDLPPAMLFAHVAPAFIAYGLFFVACMTSVVYIFQDRHLKRHNTTGLFRQLPSLERLDQMLYLLIRIGYPIFVLTIVLGAIWAYFQNELLNVHWWLSPKVGISVCTAAFYSFCFHARRRGSLSGTKLAYVVCIGVVIVLATYLLLAAFDLRDYNFWPEGKA